MLQVVLEEFGGEVLSTQLSAKTGKGLNELLEQICLLSDTLELRVHLLLESLLRAPSRSAAFVCAYAAHLRPASMQRQLHE